MKFSRLIFLTSFSIFLVSMPYGIFAKNNKDVFNLDRSRELFLEGYIQRTLIIIILQLNTLQKQ